MIKLNKKNFNLCVAVLFIALFLVNISVFASTLKTVDVTNSFSKTSINPGESFTQTIGLENYSGVVIGIQAAMFVVNYDSSNFSCEVLSRSSEISSDELTTTKTENQISVFYLDNANPISPITKSQAAITIKYTAKSNITTNDYKFTLSSGVVKAFADCDYSPIEGQMDVKPIFSQNAIQTIKIITKNYATMPVSGSSARSADFSMTAQLDVVDNENIITLKIGTANWINVVNGINGLNIKLGYDSNIFEYKTTTVTEESKIQIGKDDFTATDFNEDVLAILYMDKDFKSPIPSEGDIFIVTFKVMDGVETGGYRFNLYGDKVVVDGQYPKGNSIPVNYPNQKTIFFVGTTSPTASSTSSNITNSSSVSNNSSSISTSNLEDIKNIIESIEALPEKVTEENATEVNEIIEEYNKLPDEIKEKVVNYDVLEKSNSTINNIISEKNKSLTLIIILVIIFLAFAVTTIIFIFKLRKKRN